VQSVNYDVFNGDADGLCALHQLRLAYPQKAELITGVKRDIRLLHTIDCQQGDQITVLDLSLDTNFAELSNLLERGARFVYFDHHAASKRFAHPGLQLHWDEDPDMCTSLLVDHHLAGRHQLWAIVAAFGDNLLAVGERMAHTRGLSITQMQALKQLGFLLNYNAYGEQISDLHYHPADLYAQMHAYISPFDCIAEAEFFPVLAEAYANDAAKIRELQPVWQRENGCIYVLPNQKWARRMSGMLANQLSQDRQHQSFAVLTQREDGDYLVSVRSASPEQHPAHVFCTNFPSGGGRQLAAGINSLPAAQLEQFSQHFFSYF
jgi:hypothetical protein